MLCALVLCANCLSDKQSGAVYEDLWIIMAVMQMFLRSVGTLPCGATQA